MLHWQADSPYKLFIPSAYFECQVAPQGSLDEHPSSNVVSLNLRVDDAFAEETVTVGENASVTYIFSLTVKFKSCKCYLHFAHV